MHLARGVLRLALAVVVPALVLGACHPAPDVQVLGGTNRIADDEPSPRHSSIFDGNVVSVRAARGETVGLEVRVTDGRRRVVRLTLPPSVATVSGFRIESVVVRAPSTSMYGPSLGAGSYPDVLVPVQGAVAAGKLAYFDVAVAAAARPGRYDGTLTIDQRSLPVVLRIARARIDLEPDPLVWAYYRPDEIARAHGLADDDGPDEIARERAYVDLFRAHGVLLASDLRPDRFAPRRDFVRDVRYWPVAVDTASDAAIAADTRRWVGLFRGTGVTPFAIPVDEPHTTAERARARHIADVIGQAGGGKGTLLRAVTDVASAGYGSSIDVFISPKNLPGIARERRSRGERFWTYNGRPPEAGSMILDTDGNALRTWGWIAFRYGVELWYAWEALYFADRYNGGGPSDVTRHPITFDERRHGGTDFGNEDGVLAYPGPLPSLRLKALRQGLEDRLLLQELEACGGGAAARRIAGRMIPRALADGHGAAAWPASPLQWDRAHDQILDAIEATCPGVQAP